MSHLTSDLRLAVRLLLRDRAFTFVAVLTLALAIGATTAVSSVVYQVMLRPLPYSEPDRLVRLWNALSPKDPVRRPRLNQRISVALPRLDEWRERTKSFSRLEAVALGTTVLTGSGPAEQLRLARVSAGLFPMLDVRFAAGNPWTDEAEIPGRDRVVAISDELWRKRFGGAQSAIGATIQLAGEPHVVVAVLPPGFAFAPADVWKPLARTGEGVRYDGPWVWVAGQLRPGVTLEQARAELARVEDELRVAHPERSDYTGIAIEAWHDQLVADGSKTLWLLSGIVSLLLLIACVNVTNLLLARASARASEVALRAALGASSRRLFTQFIVESALLSVLGAAAGLLFAMWAVNLLALFVPRGILPEGDASLQLEPVAVAFALGVSVLTTLVFGIAPALQASRARALGALGRGSTRPGRLRSVLVAVQVALALAPLVGAGLMLRTLQALADVPLGFEPAGVTVGELYFAAPRYSGDDEDGREQRRRVFDELVARVGELPGIESAGVVTAVPLGGRDAAFWIDVEGRSDGAPKGLSGLRAASRGYFEALGIPLKAGRLFGPEDRADGPEVAVVNESFARRYFGDESPLGRRVRIGGEEEAFDTWKEIVGVVGDVRHKRIDGEPNPELFNPSSQFALPRMFLVVRSARATSELAPVLREQLAAIDSELALTEIRPMTDLVQADTERRRVLGTLFAVLAAIGVALAGIGLYGVASFAVVQRTRELAIRLALGAREEQVIGLVVREGAWLACAGIGLGLFGAYALAQSLKGLLYGVTDVDPLTWCVLPIALLGIAIVASWLPARRVLKLDPQEALRAE